MEDNGQENAAEIPEPMPVEAIPEPQGEPAPVEIKTPESRLRRTMRRGMRWLLGFLIVFGLGAVLVVFTLYLPARREIQRAGEAYQELENKYQAEVEQAKQQARDLEHTKNSLSALEALKQSQDEQLDMANLHVVVLIARSDVVQARLALAKDDPSKAQIALNKTPSTLKVLEEMLKPEQRNVIVDMQDLLADIQQEIGSNISAAELKLDMIATGLLELENAYFTGP